MPQSPLVSVLVPVYNEEEFVEALIERVIAACRTDGIRVELVVVDDGSTDLTPQILEDLVGRHPATIRLIRHPVNHGKGAAIRTALDVASGDFGIIQDADLEYDPSEYSRLLKPLLEGRADVVYGSRFLVSGERRVLYFWHSLANHLLTGVCNMVADLNLTDVETCYKAFRMSLVKSIPLRSQRFGIEPELTIKLAQRRTCIYEVPISYYGRTYEEGKKIGFRDAVAALGAIVRWWLVRDVYVDPGGKILDTLSRTRNFNQWMADQIRPAVGQRVIELGAGIGNLTRYLCSGRRRYVATDIDDEHLARLRVGLYARPNAAVARCDLSHSADFQPFTGQMDTVICLNVLEHVLDDCAALRNIHSALCPGGTAIILVPQDPSIYGTLDRVLGHHRRYSEAELRDKMEQTGFSVSRIWQFNRVTRPGWFWNGRVLRRTTFSRFQLWVFDSLIWLWRRIDHLMPWQSVSLIAVGTRRQ